MKTYNTDEVIKEGIVKLIDLNKRFTIIPSERSESDEVYSGRRVSELLKKACSEMSSD